MTIAGYDNKRDERNPFKGSQFAGFSEPDWTEVQLLNHDDAGYALDYALLTGKYRNNEELIKKLFNNCKLEQLQKQDLINKIFGHAVYSENLSIATFLLQGLIKKNIYEASVDEGEEISDFFRGIALLIYSPETDDFDEKFLIELAANIITVKNNECFFVGTNRKCDFKVRYRNWCQDLFQAIKEMKK